MSYDPLRFSLLFRRFVIWHRALRTRLRASCTLSRLMPGHSPPIASFGLARSAATRVARTTPKTYSYGLPSGTSIRARLGGLVVAVLRKRRVRSRKAAKCFPACCMRMRVLRPSTASSPLGISPPSADLLARASRALRVHYACGCVSSTRSGAARPELLCPPFVHADA